MKTGENISFCPKCPNMGACVGPLESEVVHTTDTSFFSSRKEDIGKPIIMGTSFIDIEGNESDIFTLKVSLEDVAACNKSVTNYRTGFLGHRAIKACGADIANIRNLQERVAKSLNRRN
jgi:hypothetical protein